MRFCWWPLAGVKKPLCLHAAELLIQDAQHAIKCLVISGPEKARRTRDSTSVLPLPANAAKSRHPISNPITQFDRSLPNQAANLTTVQIRLNVNDLTHAAKKKKNTHGWDVDVSKPPGAAGLLFRLFEQVSYNNCTTCSIRKKRKKTRKRGRRTGLFPGRLLKEA